MSGEVIRRLINSELVVTRFDQDLQLQPCKLLFMTSKVIYFVSHVLIQTSQALTSFCFPPSSPWSCTGSPPV